MQVYNMKGMLDNVGVCVLSVGGVQKGCAPQFY